MPEKRKVLIVDDHPLFREGLSNLIERSTGYEIVGECGSGSESIQMAESLEPNLITMDMSLPDMDGTEAIREIKELLPETLILILSMHSGFEYVSEGFRAGAMGYVVKETTSDKLIQAMDTIYEGQYFLDGNVSQEVVSKMLASPTKNNTKQKENSYSLLTPREKEILGLIAEGLSYREIAKQLFISPKTVENHRANIMAKLDVHKAVDLVKYAAKIGLIDMS